MSIGAMMGAALLVLLIQLSVRGRAYGSNRPGDIMPAMPNAELAELAERRNWTVSACWTERLGHRRTIIGQRDGEGWTYSLETWNAMLGHAVYGHNPRDGEWLDASVQLAEGVVIVGPTETAEAVAFITGVISFFQSDKGRDVANGLHRLPDGMKLVDKPGPDMPITLLSDLPVAPDLPYEVIVRHLRVWTARRPNKEDHPVISYQPSGLRVRLVRSTRDLALTEALIDFANALRGEIGV